MSLLQMRIGSKKFEAKTTDRISENFRRWRDQLNEPVNTIGTHWTIRRGGKRCGELTYDGQFWPADSDEERPWQIVEDVLAERFRTHQAHSREYQAGARAALEWVLMRSPMGCPYPAGSVEADAFVAGLDEGQRLSSALRMAIRTTTCEMNHRMHQSQVAAQG